MHLTAGETAFKAGTDEILNANAEGAYGPVPLPCADLWKLRAGTDVHFECDMPL